ncbi:MULTISPECIES: DinB family protein [Bacillus]|uniref:DinB family protein n=1 Tax=Bacillus TaxID=1386 RepID=UPI0003F98249|nr:MULTISPECIES: DinB family protein [Bacillus]QHZ44865.1 DinB family protein [Bacillus sp. NSP9.1]QHZ45946.1 DinB family protein [Bacillus sp. NSP9.1]WFA04275.1 DinB family protein [Bacillus sp. HSf4]
MSIFNEARKELWSELQGLSDEDLNKRPAEEEWSVQEVLDHLKKIDLMAAHLFKEKIQHAPIKTIEEKPVKIAEERSPKRKAPQHVEPERKNTDLLTIKAELDNVRTQLTSVIAAFQEEDFQRVLPHPVFKELTVRQWIDFIGHHEKRHIQQIQEIKQKLGRD